MKVYSEYYGWNQPMGASGLICFDSAGRILWEFKPPAGFDSICNCYVLNVAKDAVWACYYTDFSVGKIDSDKRVQGWKNDAGGASALAVDGRRVLLWGGCGEKRSRCVVQDIGSEALTRKLIQTIDKTIEHLKGPKKMKSQELFVGFPKSFSTLAFTAASFLINGGQHRKLSRFARQFSSSRQCRVRCFRSSHAS